MNELELRMYGLVPFNLKEIYQGIQYGHAIQEFNNGIRNTTLDDDSYSENFKIEPHLLKEKFIKWSTVDKTFILLNGGPTNWDIGSKGMREHFNLLEENNIPFSYFEEPDLNNALTAICFLVDERVYDKKKYPDFDHMSSLLNGERILGWKYLLKGREYRERLDDLFVKEHNEWVESIGGESNVFLREFLKDKRLA